MYKSSRRALRSLLTVKQNNSQCRKYASNTASSSQNSPIQQYRSALPVESFTTPSYELPEFLTQSPATQITTLSNGVRVVSEPRVGETAAVGIFIKAGSRQENKSNNGVAHFLEHMYFKVNNSHHIYVITYVTNIIFVQGTKKRSGHQLELEFENAGALLNAHTAREYTAFTSHCLKGDVERSVDALSDILLNSELREADIERERSTILTEYDEVSQSIEEVLFDELHGTAFQQSSLGYTILGPKENIKTITRKQMIDYRDTFYTAPRMTLIGVGDIDHSQLVRLGEKYLGTVPAAPASGKSDKTEYPSYIGSDVRVFNEEIPNLHMAIGFQGPGLASADILTISLIQLLLGSYDKTMGAGKYVSPNLANLLADNNLARLLVPFNHAYSDTGLFGVQIISDGGEDTDTLMCETVHHMTKLCYRVIPEDLERAKNVFKSQILSQYEGGLKGVLEEVGRQILFYGRRPSAAEMFARIDAITTEDIKRVATKYIYDQDPVMSAIGNTQNMVDYTWLRMFTTAWRM
jgi:processing peptidase subunit beta